MKPCFRVGLDECALRTLIPSSRNAANSISSSPACAAQHTSFADWRRSPFATRTASFCATGSGLTTSGIAYDDISSPSMYWFHFLSLISYPAGFMLQVAVLTNDSLITLKRLPPGTHLSRKKRLKPHKPLQRLLCRSTNEATSPKLFPFPCCAALEAHEDARAYAVATLERRGILLFIRDPQIALTLGLPGLIRYRYRYRREYSRLYT